MSKTYWNPEHSDYLDRLNGRNHAPTSHANDSTMAKKTGAWSDFANTPWNATGYDLTERTGEDNNDFYRNYAKYMPGYDIDGIPCGAWAQNAATNHVGQGEGPNSPWTRVRDSLVLQESQRIQERQAAGESGKLSFMDLYDAHYNAYNQSGGGGNQFIDPLSFAGAVYGSPLLEVMGIDAGPFNGAMIDVFNDPTDSATEGWAKRMGLAAGEIGAGALMMTNPLTAPLGLLTMGAGAFGAGWNTASAIFDGGMLGEWGDAISDGAGALWDGAVDVGGDIASGAGELWDGAVGVGGDIVDGAGELIDGAGGVLSDAGSAIGSFFGL